jgi:hypothetical protein
MCRLKALTLPFHVCQGALAQTVVVQAGFAYAYHLGLFAHGQQILQTGFLNVLLVGVNAGSAPEIVVRLRHGVDIGKGFHSGADEQGA